MVSDFHKKGNRESSDNELLFKTVGIFLIIVFCVLVFSDFKIYQKKQQLVAQINAYKKQIEDVKKSSQTLQTEIGNSDNVDYLEKLGYEQLGQARPGETEYMFVKSANKTAVAPAPSGSENVWGIFTGWLSQSWDWIKNKF